MIESGDDGFDFEGEDFSPFEGHEPEESEDPTGSEEEDLSSDFQLPAGFSRSLLPNMDDYQARLIAPLQAQMCSFMPDYSDRVRGTLAPLNEKLRVQVTSGVANVPTFSMPPIEPIDLPVLQSPTLDSATQAMLTQLSSQRETIIDGFRKSLGPLFDPELLRGFNGTLLPPNLKEYADKIKASEVHRFVEEEGIPLYLVPRGRTALRLLRAKDCAGRRRVLGDCYGSLMDDCAAVLERSDHEAVSDELAFAFDGLGAMRAGHARSAQAMFTVTLDSLIYRFYPDRKDRGVITNRKRGAAVPDEIDEMSVRAALVWLPIWNAHEEFWKHKGDEVPHYYSRHASVHGVSSRQFSKRNCIQVLMLVTSLIGYADYLARRAS